MLKKMRLFSILFIILVLSYSTTCFAEEHVSVGVDNNESIYEQEIEPMSEVWAFIPTTSGRISILAGTYIPGASSYYVKLIQATLNALGHNCGTVDGIYGTNTRNAIIEFQSMYGLSTDGIAGEVTWAYLAQCVRTNNIIVPF